MCLERYNLFSKMNRIILLFIFLLSPLFVYASTIKVRLDYISVNIRTLDKTQNEPVFRLFQKQLPLFTEIEVSEEDYNNPLTHKYTYEDESQKLTPRYGFVKIKSFKAPGLSDEDLAVFNENNGDLYIAWHLIRDMKEKLIQKKDEPQSMSVKEMIELLKNYNSSTPQIPPPTSCASHDHSFDHSLQEDKKEQERDKSQDEQVAPPLVTEEGSSISPVSLPDMSISNGPTLSSDSSEQQTYQTLNRYQEAYKEFQKRKKGKIFLNRTLTKQLFLETLFDILPETKPDGSVDYSHLDHVLMSLTAVGEAGYGSYPYFIDDPQLKGKKISDVDRMAEFASMYKVIENRAASNQRINPQFLKNGPYSKFNSVIDSRNTISSEVWNPKGDLRRSRAILSNKQFSTWNVSDNNLSRIMNLDPSLSSGDVDTFRLALLTAKEMDQGKIKVSDKLKDFKTRHYVSVSLKGRSLPRWSKEGSQLNQDDLSVEIENRGTGQVRLHKFYNGVR